ncbi:MAG TPA: hypothetical protein VGX48_21785 [Pyrinomonadaceae bacterium]|jgi:hypothetical protein|nr:hypothetical protein [Pyrinomonadaceae bacterium]
MLWVLFSLTLIGGGLSWFAWVPVYVSGAAVVTGRAAQSSGEAGEAVLVVLVPVCDSQRLRPGQRAFFRFGGEAVVLVGKVESVEPHSYDPEVAKSRFALDDGVVWKARWPAAVAFAKLEAGAAASLRSADVERFGEVRVEVGSRRAFSRLPLASRLIEDGQK